MREAYPQATYIPFHLSVYMYTVSNQVPMMIDVRQNIDTVPMSMLIHPDYRTEKAELFLLSIRMLVLCRQTLAASNQIPETSRWLPAAPLKKATLSFQQSGFFIPCRGRELIAAECCLCCLLTQLIPCLRVHPCDSWAVIYPCRRSLLANWNVVYVVFLTTRFLVSVSIRVIRGRLYLLAADHCWRIGMLSMLSSYPTDSLFPCPSVRSVGGYISLPQIIVGESEELSMLSSKNLHLTRPNAPIQR